ncbi:class I SAM-dependent methyltransferase [Aliiroseovarius sp. PTFE2010]|uniref:class I SAM-dependent methyltransferase n=1 Tax=Aliiroseovarius sp. PTFE2010 TaxID=3417190 RepID=UPI003CE8EAE3
MWEELFDRMCRTLIRHGSLDVTPPGGRKRRYGDGQGEAISVTMHDPSMLRGMVLAPDMTLGEGYMNGDFTIEGDDLRGFLSLVIKSIADAPTPWFQRPLQALHHGARFLAQYNPVGKAQQNVAHHYDLSEELYDLFLDEDRQYSCAYFRRPDLTLEDAQAAKKQHIARKLRIEPGMRVLDIGCGWGGMALTLARDYGAEVVGVTLSREQHAYAVRRAKEAGLDDRVDFRLTDYRNLTERFDRIVSVGMFEHVGVPHYRQYFRNVHDMLAEDGVALIHTIGRASPPGVTSPWINKYIFPGGYCPAMSETMQAVEKEGLIATDIEVWRLHYAETLARWYDRFMANIDRAEAIYDARFTRMWRYYLLASELTFRHNRQVVFQFQLTRRQDAVPLTRDYMYTQTVEQDRKLAAE